MSIVLIVETEIGRYEREVPNTDREHLVSFAKELVEDGEMSPDESLQWFYTEGI